MHLICQSVSLRLTLDDNNPQIHRYRAACYLAGVPDALAEVEDGEEDVENGTGPSQCLPSS